MSSFAALIGGVTLGVIAGLVGINDAEGFPGSIKLYSKFFAIQAGHHIEVMTNAGVAMAKPRKTADSFVAIIIVNYPPYIDILSTRAEIADRGIWSFASLRHAGPRLDDPIYGFVGIGNGKILVSRVCDFHVDMNYDILCGKFANITNRYVSYPLVAFSDQLIDAAWFPAQVGSQLALSGFLGGESGFSKFVHTIMRGLSGLGGGASRVASIGQSKPYQDNGHKTESNLPLGRGDKAFGGSGHRLLGHQVVLLTILGSLALFIAGWFGGPLVLDGPGLTKRFVGGCILASWALVGAVLWGWGLFGYPLAFFDKSVAFGRVLLGG